MTDKSKCIGCYNNFYNGNNNLGVSECWSLKTAKMQTRFRISVNSPMGTRGNYVKVRKPSCYRENGYVHIAAIPSYAE